MDFVHRLAF